MDPRITAAYCLPEDRVDLLNRFSRRHFDLREQYAFFEPAFKRRIMSMNGNFVGTHLREDPASLLATMPQSYFDAMLEHWRDYVLALTDHPVDLGKPNGFPISIVTGPFGTNFRHLLEQGKIYVQRTEAWQLYGSKEFDIKEI